MERNPTTTSSSRRSEQYVTKYESSGRSRNQSSTVFSIFYHNVVFFIFFLEFSLLFYRIAENRQLRKNNWYIIFVGCNILYGIIVHERWGCTRHPVLLGQSIIYCNVTKKQHLIFSTNSMLQWKYRGTTNTHNFFSGLEVIRPPSRLWWWFNVGVQIFVFHLQPQLLFCILYYFLIEKMKEVLSLFVF